MNNTDNKAIPVELPVINFLVGVVEIEENGKRFSAYIPYKFSGDTNKIIWTRVGVSRKFRYVRCEFCGRLIAQRSAGWYAHLEKHFNTDIKVISQKNF